MAFDALLFPVLFHLGNAVALLALLLRDQLALRVVLLASLILQGIYYFGVPGGPLIDPLIWKVILVTANLAMIVAVFRDRLPFGSRAICSRCSARLRCSATASSAG